VADVAECLNVFAGTWEGLSEATASEQGNARGGEQFTNGNILFTSQIC
jgi:hypothetical protein